ncbi:hypothetical protein [Spiribacter onubensis]|uniref:Uncharacterized protein n=1 Tax=Spiribacter onubensis TaxID=3122420 RepID=A0ABV3S7Z3_9GAMM
MRNYLFTAALLCGAIGTAQAAQLDMSGAINNRCSFGTVTSGIMTVNESDFSQFGTENIGAQRATVSVSYFGTPTLTISTPAGFSNAPDLTDAGTVSFAHLAVLGTADAAFENTDIGPSTDVTHQFTSGSSDTVQVGVTATGTNALPVGNYEMVTEATCI